ncbi:type II toxin-antitoxin system RnlA family toxin [Pseudodesulfovibrio sp.]|uniref:type II toxin-antitoxin system RnlA family toxin n=1 Tax=unclassified Pseudodesulfovibrio TaxID=2661612 RepID=UPI003AFFC372
MSYRDKALVADMIRPKLGEYADGPVELELKPRENHYHFLKNGKPVHLVVYPKNNGLFTLQAAGKNQDLANEAAEYVIEHASSVKMKNFSLTLHDYTKDKLETLVAYLTEECSATTDDPVEIPHGLSLKVKGKQGDVLTFTLYKKGTLLIQGRPVVLALDVVQFLAEDDAISQDDVLKHLGTIFSTPTSAAEATKQLTNEYPHAYAYAGENLTKLLGTAISMRGLPMEVDDYSVISYPALRALEAFMRKSVLNACGEYWREFDQFHKTCQSPLTYKLNADAKVRIGCDTTCCLLEECYSYYNPNRHGTFHASGVDAEIRTIGDRTEAVLISSNCLDLINNYSELLLEK